MAENIDQSINDFSHRIMKEMQLLTGERYPLGINCLGTENLSYLFENRCLRLLREEQGWRQKFFDRGAGASDRGAKMTEKWCFHALFCQISSDENPKFPPTGG